MPSTNLPDALADALGRVVADVQRQASKDYELLASECRSIVADLKLQIAVQAAEILKLREVDRKRIDDAIASVKDGDPGDPGKSITVDDVRPLIDGLVGKAIAGLPKPLDGKDTDPAVVTSLVATEVDRAVAALPRPADGKSVSVDDVRPMLAEMVTTAIAALPPAPAGKDADPAAVRLMVAEEVAKIPPATNGKDADPELIARLVDEAVAQIPPAPAGKDADPAAVRLLVAEEVGKIPPASNGKDADPEVIARFVDAAVGKIPPAPAGKDADPAAVAALVTAEVDRAVAALPKPADGKSIEIDDVRPLVADLVGKAVAALPVVKDGKDGVGLAGAVIDREGCLILTLTDGSTKSLGCVVGRDADQAAISKQIEELVAKFPKPKDGKDGFGFDDLSVGGDGERTITLRFTRGDQVKEFTVTLPVPIDRGVWREGTYKRGDCVSFGGSSFTAQCDTDAKPEASPDWRLSAKRGRDGASAFDVARKAGFRGTEAEWLKSLRGPPGKGGDPGKDLTQMGPNGQKW